MSAKTRQRFTIGYLIAIILTDFIGLGVSVTTFPSLMLSGGPVTAAASESQRLMLLGILLGIYPLGQFFGAAILGKLSDMRGRRPLLLITLLGTLAGFLVSAAAIDAGSLWLLMIGRLAAGLFAGNVAIAQAGMVDISDAESKSGNLALLNAAMGISWIIGPPLGGILSDSKLVSWFSVSTPFWFEAGLLAAMFVFTTLFFKETLPNRTKADINVLAGLAQVRDAFARPKLRLAFAIWGVFVAGWWLFESYLPTYLLQVFHFEPARIGGFLAFMGTTFTVTSLFVVKPLASRMRPETMVRSFLILSAAAVVGLALATNAWQLHIAAFFFVSTMGFALPGLMTTISNFADAETQGQTLGMTASIQAIMTVAVMMGGGSLFALSRYTTVLGGAGLLATAWVLFLLAFRERRAARAVLPDAAAVSIAQ